ncbi:MAG: hypothetical protein FK734_13155 [Asgard group archaeon]|nr:hypothetical protein [Asgard group archaeon]
MGFRNNYAKIFVSLMIIFSILPISSVMVLSMENNNSAMVLQTSSAEDKIHRGFLYTNGVLAGFVDIDAFTVILKEGKEYYFWLKADIASGALVSLAILGDGINHLEFGSWDSNDPASMRKIIYTATSTDAGNHSVLVTYTGLLLTDICEYTLYINQVGIAGYWWMIAAGVGALLIVIIVIVLIAKAVKPKKKKGKRKR